MNFHGWNENQEWQKRNLDQRRSGEKKNDTLWPSLKSRLLQIRPDTRWVNEQRTTRYGEIDSETGKMKLGTDKNLTRKWNSVASESVCGELERQAGTKNSQWEHRLKINRGKHNAAWSTEKLGSWQLSEEK
jgi:hypothetical protein